MSILRGPKFLENREETTLLVSCLRDHVLREGVGMNLSEGRALTEGDEIEIFCKMPGITPGKRYKVMKIESGNYIVNDKGFGIAVDSILRSIFEESSDVEL